MIVGSGGWGCQATELVSVVAKRTPQVPDSSHPCWGVEPLEPQVPPPPLPVPILLWPLAGCPYLGELTVHPNSNVVVGQVAKKFRRGESIAAPHMQQQVIV